MTDGHCDHCDPGCDGANEWHYGDPKMGGVIWASGHCPMCAAAVAERARIVELLNDELEWQGSQAFVNPDDAELNAAFRCGVDKSIRIARGDVQPGGGHD